MIAKGKNIRISPKKLRVVAEVVRWQTAIEALEFLKFAPKKWASILYKILYSAVKNAEHNEKEDIKQLYVDRLVINKWIVYKRWNPVSRWRMNPILKRTSNIELKLDYIY